MCRVHIPDNFDITRPGQQEPEIYRFSALFVEREEEIAAIEAAVVLIGP